MNPLDKLIKADLVREGRLDTPQQYIGEVKFAQDPDTGDHIGIDTTHGHRWTINYDSDRAKHKMVDHKLGVMAHHDSVTEAKGSALRAAAEATDNTPVDPYGKEAGAKPMYEDVPTLPVEKLRTLFPGHYLTK